VEELKCTFLCTQERKGPIQSNNFPRRHLKRGKKNVKEEAGNSVPKKKIGELNKGSVVDQNRDRESHKTFLAGKYTL